MSENKDVFSQHKLMKHLDKLDSFQKGEIVYPIHVNINISNRCNNNCPLCTTKDKNGIIAKTEDVKKLIYELGELGVNCLGYGGGGDPACHPDLAEIIRYSKANGMEVAVTTNGYGLSEDIIEAIVDCAVWIRVSLDADSPVIYKKTHGMNEQAFKQVIENLRKLVETKKRKKSNLVIGTTYLIGPHTIDGAYNATKLCKEIGINNIRLRPFFNFGNLEYKKDEVDLFVNELARCKELQDENFLVSYPNYRYDSMLNKQSRTYSKCNIHHLNPIITPDLKIYPCCFLIDMEKYCLGDLTKKSFKEIWSSEERKQAYERINFKDCPNPCALDPHNNVLWAVKTNTIPKGMNLIDLLKSVKEPILHCNFF